MNAISGIMEGTSDLIAAVDSELRFLVFNRFYQDSFFHHFGVRIEVGDSLEKALAHMPDARDFVVGCWRRALNGEAHTEQQFQDDPDHERWYETRYSPICDGAGNVVGASHISRAMSHRIRTEMELLRSEQKFRALFENAADAIYVFDLDGHIFDANRKAYEQLGYTKDELLHMSPWDIDSQEQARNIRERIETIKRDGELTFETRHRRKDGTHIPVEVRAKMVFYAEQDAMLAVVRDLTERERTRQAKREREEMYRGLFLNDHSAMLLVDPETKEIVEANAAAAAFYGYDRESLEGMRIGELNIAAEEDIRCNVNEALSFSQNRFEFTHRLASGELREVEIFSGPVCIRGRRLLFSIVHDITEKKRSEQALRRSEAVFRSLADSNLVGVGFGDSAGEITYVNDEMLRMMGYTREDFEAGRINWKESIAPEFQETNIVNLEELERDGRSMGHEKAFLRPDGGRTPFLGGAASIESEPNIHVSIAVDLTPAKKAQQQLRESENKFRRFFQANPDGVALLAWEDGRHLDSNEAYLRFFGYSREELVGRTTVELQVWAEPDEREAFRALVAKQGMTRNFEARLRNRAGEVRTALVSADTVEIDGVRCLLTVLNDISDRKNMERSLLRKNAILEGLGRIFWDSLTCETEEELGVACLSVAEALTGSGIGFLAEIGDDSTLHNIAISDSGWEVCDMPAQDSSKSSILPGKLPIHGLYGSVLTSGASLVSNSPAEHPESTGAPGGHPKLESFLGVPLKQGETTLGMIGLGNKPGGYTEEDAEAVETLAVAVVEALLRKRAEKQVESLAKFPEENPNPVLRLNMDGTLLYANQASAFLLDHWGIQAGGVLPAGPLEDVRAAMDEGEVQEFEVEIADRVYTIALAPMQSQGYVNIYGLDITERKRAERALRESRRDLKRAQQVARVGNWRMDMRRNRLKWSEETHRI
ncbi:MAG: PAS domain S-box protein, partial [Oceanidesulfovibrio sp.]